MWIEGHMVSGKLRKELTDWVKKKKGDKYLIEAGHEIAVNDRSETLGGMMQQIRGGQSKWEVNEGCKQMWMGKGVRERQTRWNNQPLEEAVCKMETQDEAGFAQNIEDGDQGN